MKFTNKAKVWVKEHKEELIVAGSVLGTLFAGFMLGKVYGKSKTIKDVEHELRYACVINIFNLGMQVQSEGLVNEAYVCDVARKHNIEEFISTCSNHVKERR